MDGYLDVQSPRKRAPEGPFDRKNGCDSVAAVAAATVAATTAIAAAASAVART